MALEAALSFKNTKELKACGYFRLSREDGDKAESDSIKNQKIMVRDFAARNGIAHIEEYVDDGFTGTNFNRPSFLRLWEDIKVGKINCIIVKDLSRLGRNYIEMGKYLTQWFPQFGVRIIAINDNYDSLDEQNVSNQIIVPFKNLINDAYCRDMSIKVRSQLDMKRKNGKFIGSFAVYGYEKDVDDHNKLVIDETAAKVVEMIFNMKLDGYSSIGIVRKLTEPEIFCKAQEIIKPNHIKRYNKHYLLKRWIYFQETDERLSYREKETDGKRIAYYHRPQDDICLIEYEDVIEELRRAIRQEKELASRVCKVDYNLKLSAISDIDDSYQERAKELFRLSVEAQSGNVELYERYDSGEITQQEYDLAHETIKR